MPKEKHPEGTVRHARGKATGGLIEEVVDGRGSGKLDWWMVELVHVAMLVLTQVFQSLRQG